MEIQLKQKYENSLETIIEKHLNQSNVETKFIDNYVRSLYKTNNGNYRLNGIIYKSVEKEKILDDNIPSFSMELYLNLLKTKKC
jgi:hypothetical protein